MTIFSSTQKTATLTMIQGMPGDMYTTIPPAYITAYFTKGNVIIGNACYTNNGNQITPNKIDASYSIAGIVLRNSGLQIQARYTSGMIVEPGSQLQATQSGKVLCLVVGIKADSTADHIPKIGEQVFVNQLDGSLGCSPIGVLAVTGYDLALGLSIFRVGMSTTATLSSNQTLCVISGLLSIN